MTKKVALKGVLLAFVAFLLAFAYTGTASAYDLYELDNAVSNGDFNSNITGWSTATASPSWNAGRLRGIGDGTGSYILATFTQANAMTGGHVYYMAFDIMVSSMSGVANVMWYSGTGYPTLQTAVSAGVNATSMTRLSYIVTATATKSNIQMGLSVGAPYNTGISIYWDNILFIDLTAQFGAGLEPSLSDFELLYLPSDLDYFDTYQSFDAGSYTQLSLSSYTDLASDLTGIDYKKSVIDTYGENIDVSIYAYFFDTPSYRGDQAAQYYYTLNNPEISWRNTTYQLDWSFSDYSDRVLYLDLDADQTTILKRALFDRSIGTDWDADFTDDQGYLKLDVEGTAVDNVKFYMVFSSVFDLRVDIQSFLISYDTDVHENTFSINQELYIKCQDKYDQTLLPALFAQMGDYGTKVIDDFGSAYTDVLSFNIEFEFTSPEPTDDSLVQTIYLYELGAFSSSDVVIGNYDPTLPLPFDPQVCDWYELGCQAKNGVNDFVAWFYDKFDIEAISASVSDIFDSFDQVISLMPDEIIVILSIVGSALVAILIIVIVDRITGGRSG